MELKYIGTDENVWGNKIETYVLQSNERKQNGLPIEFVFCKETIGCYDENGNETIGIGCNIAVSCDKYTSKIRKLIEKHYKTYKPFKNMIATDTYVSPIDADSIFNTYVNAVKEVC